ncbi:hypothetical protein EDD15DRAFT_2155432 [Pisolithus albus]|nr:hypothetical protein EDD15DRAFT_2155432 [Pisolithus albus]
MSIPLPPNPFPPSAFHAAYQRCLALEAEAPYVEVLQACPAPIVCARLLGHLLRLAPAGNGQSQLQREIAIAVDNVELMRLAGNYLNHFIRAFKRSSGPTPQPSEHPSRPSSEDARQYSLALMNESTLDHRTARAAAKRRDNNRCMLTGDRDYQDGGVVWVDCVHIIPESTNRNIREEGKKQSHSASVWTILSMFADINILEELAGNRIHRLENIMSMEQGCHTAFDELVLWLKPVEVRSLDTYHTHASRPGVKEKRNIPDIVTFSTTTGFRLPNPTYLALHALCCEVAWMSGAAEYIMDIERRMDQTRVLAEDGSTADILSSALALV